MKSSPFAVAAVAAVAVMAVMAVVTGKSVDGLSSSDMLLM
jgi:hypothetical protein